MAQKRNTKQIILEEAFKLCDESPKSVFSLSELAEKVGISKTAIFRHFKNKDELLSGMASYFMDKLAEVFRDKTYFAAAGTNLTHDYDEFRRLMLSVLKLFMENTGFLGFVISAKKTVSASADKLFEGLARRGVVISTEFVKAKSLQRFLRVYFCSETVIYFLSRRSCLTRNGIYEFESDEQFVETVIDVIWNGVGKNKEILERLNYEELDKLCEFNIDELPENTRYFTAFAEAFQEVGFDGLTVEKISEKLNLSKSSLYAFFENKDEFITKMLSEEFSVLMKVITEKTKSVTSLEELAYILFRCEKNYLEKRPYVVMIHFWASQKGFTIRYAKMKDGTAKRPDYSAIEKNNIELPPHMNLSGFVGWVSSLVGALKIFFTKPQFKGVEEVFDFAEELYDLLLNGIKNREDKVTDIRPPSV